MSSLFDRVKMTVSGTPGTGAITLGSAVLDAANGDYLSFVNGGVTDGTLVSYVAIDGHNWGKGHGVYTAAGTSLSRDAAEVTWNGSTVGNTPISLTSAAVVLISALHTDLPFVLENWTAAGGETSHTPPTIPTGWSDIEFEIIGRGNAAGSNPQLAMTVNGLNTAIYSVQRLYAQNVTVSSDQQLAQTTMAGSSGWVALPSTSAQANQDGFALCRIHRYAGSTWKTGEFTNRQPNSNSTDNSYAVFGTMQFDLTAAITSFTVSIVGGPGFAAGSSIITRLLP